MNQITIKEGETLFLPEACISRWKVLETVEGLLLLYFDTQKTKQDRHYHIQHTSPNGFRLRKGEAPKK